jgi:hypothetical protein
MPNAIIPDSGLAAWMQRIVDYFNEAANDLTLRLSNTPHDDDEWETVTLADLNEPTFPGYFAQPMAGFWTLNSAGPIAQAIPIPVQWIWFIDPSWTGEDDLWSAFIRDGAGNVFGVYPLIARPVHITGASGHYQVFPLFDFRSRFTVP